MSLRVLLADESASIRKVFQMGLQDFGAEVKSVHNGLDVIEVAKNYKPHIVFADVLLQKKNGYEVCSEMKQHSDLKSTPMILMWSSFMELDQKKYQSCDADGELEKPFDVESMRQLLKKHVDLAQNQEISDFLKFPSHITKDFIEEESQKGRDYQSVATTPPQTTQADDSSAPAPSFTNENENSAPKAEPPLTLDEPITDENSQEPSSFFNMQVDTPEEHKAQSGHQPSSEAELSFDESWVAKPLNDNEIAPQNTKTEDDSDHFQTVELNHDKKMNLDDFLYKPETSQGPPPIPPVKANTQSPIDPFETPPASATAHGISPEEAEAIIRSETRAIVKEKIAHLVPDILQKLVREELDNILEREMELRAPDNSPT